ncbi:MAG TPA: hypothetical protein PLU22_17555 [Polyangiaceae bacterium]|nr:hypothetical protein [Polyangiaceae bacterium]
MVDLEARVPGRLLQTRDDRVEPVRDHLGAEEGHELRSGGELGPPRQRRTQVGGGDLDLLVGGRVDQHDRAGDEDAARLRRRRHRRRAERRGLLPERHLGRAGRWLRERRDERVGEACAVHDEAAVRRDGQDVAAVHREPAAEGAALDHLPVQAVGEGVHLRRVHRGDEPDLFGSGPAPPPPGGASQVSAPPTGAERRLHGRLDVDGEADVLGRHLHQRRADAGGQRAALQATRLLLQDPMGVLSSERRQGDRTRPDPPQHPVPEERAVDRRR